MLTITSLAGLKAFLINSSSFSLQRTKSTFSPLSSDKILAILEPRSPIQVPIASILSFVDDTATLLRIPASLATAWISIVPSWSSGITDSNNLLTNP